MDNERELLTADEILGMDDIPVEDVVVPQWKNRTVKIRGLSAAAKNAYQASLVEITGTSRKVKLEHSTAKLLQKCIVNAQLQPIFTEAQILQLGTKSAKVLERLAQIANRLSGMDEGENDELLKNSDAAQTSDSPTVSH